MAYRRFRPPHRDLPLATVATVRPPTLPSVATVATVADLKTQFWLPPARSVATVATVARPPASFGAHGGRVDEAGLDGRNSPEWSATLATIATVATVALDAGHSSATAARLRVILHQAYGRMIVGRAS